MKKTFFAIILPIILIESICSQTIVKELLTENLIDPVGLDISIPRFTWILQNEKRGITQTAYEIEVESNDTFAWRSGRVLSDSSVLVAYKGLPLKSNTLYFWRVRVQDNRGYISDWSLPGSFRTGFLQPSDWKAQWITPTLEEDTVNRPSPYLRKT